MLRRTKRGRARLILASRVSAKWLSRVSRPVSLLLNLFRLQLIDIGEPTVSLIERPQDFIEFRVYGLGIAVFGALDEKRHKPGRECCDAVPIETLPVENEPENGKNSPDEERYRPIRSFANARESFSQPIAMHDK